jgi:hypothetical protein
MGPRLVTRHAVGVWIWFEGLEGDQKAHVISFDWVQSQRISLHVNNVPHYAAR